ncbi:MAG: tagatose 1,6-diphosphate aldolase [Bryobacterales bacterium]|nr:tagatose 1,6-diphosphate aldolase [Bryobacterales bacterium]
MSVPIPSEKIRRLRALADERGVITIVGADQRTSVRDALAAAKGIDPEDVEDEALRELKASVAHVLTPHASALLTEPEYGLEAAGRRAPGSGLLMAYEQSGYDPGKPGRLPELTDNLSVRRLKEMGADAVKALVRYTPFESKQANEVKRALIERVGAECRAEEMPFCLALAGYDEQGGDEHGSSYAGRRPRVVTESVRELSKPRYGVDLLAVEFPVDLRFARGSTVFEGPAAYEKSRALDAYREAAEAAERPFVYLTAGLGSAQLIESLHWAAEAGVNFCGVSCGRGIWGDGATIFGQRGVAAFDEWLEHEGVKRIDAANAALANAGSWYSFYGADEPAALAH